MNQLLTKCHSETEKKYKAFDNLRRHNAIVSALLTNCQTVIAVRLQYESADGDKGQESTGYDEVYDICERVATKM